MNVAQLLAQAKNQKARWEILPHATSDSDKETVLTAILDHAKQIGEVQKVHQCAPLNSPVEGLANEKLAEFMRRDPAKLRNGASTIN